LKDLFSAKVLERTDRYGVTRFEWAIFSESEPVFASIGPDDDFETHGQALAALLDFIQQCEPEYIIDRVNKIKAVTP
jgi:hypothetical protein